MDQIKLSILIPSLCGRTHLLSRLLSILNPQITKDIEILISIDNADKQIGQKRNELVLQAQGKYIVFIDDDDLISEDYIKEIMIGIAKDVDYIGFEQRFHDVIRNRIKKIITHIGNWNKTDEIYYKGVEHICVIRRNLAIQYKFPINSFGEDKEWGLEMDKLCKTEYYIDKVLYFYEWNKNKKLEKTNTKIM